MTTLNRTTGLALSTTLLVLTVVAGPASAYEWSMVNDDLCDYCGSYASGSVSSAYLPGIGYGQDHFQPSTAHSAPSGTTEGPSVGVALDREAALVRAAE